VEDEEEEPPYDPWEDAEATEDTGPEVLDMAALRARSKSKK